MQNFIQTQGTYIDQYHAGRNSDTTFNFMPGSDRVHFGYQRDLLQNLATIGQATMGCNAHISTPGANHNQAGEVYGAFGTGNGNAISSGQMDIRNGSCGIRGAAQGLRNIRRGQNDNSRRMMVVLL